jgi:hypothetical protein
MLRYLLRCAPGGTPSDIREAVKAAIPGSRAPEGFCRCVRAVVLSRHRGSFPVPRPVPRSTEMVPFVTPAGARDPADPRSPVTPGNAPRRRPFGSRSTSSVDGSFERHETNV